MFPAPCTDAPDATLTSASNASLMSCSMLGGLEAVVPGFAVVGVESAGGSPVGLGMAVTCP